MSIFPDLTALDSPRICIRWILHTNIPKTFSKPILAFILSKTKQNKTKPNPNPNPNPNQNSEAKSSPLMTEALNRDYQVSEEIGRGRFGTVFRCISRISGDSFAVKSIDKSLISGDSLDSQCILTEPKILQLLTPHLNIVQVFAVYEDHFHLHIVLELCDSQDLYHRIISKGIFSESESKPIVRQISQAISHMHKAGVVHRDLKPDNILFSSENTVKVSDFGSADFGGGEVAMRGVVGTPYYVAPEVLAGEDYNEKVDVWSVGVILYIMLAGFPPFYGESVTEIFDAVLRGNLRFPSRAFHSVSPLAKDLLRRMLSKDVSRRFSADQVLRHPWMQQ